MDATQLFAMTETAPMSSTGTMSTVLHMFRENALEMTLHRLAQTAVKVMLLHRTWRVLHPIVEWLILLPVTLNPFFRRISCASSISISVTGTGSY